MSGPSGLVPKEPEAEGEALRHPTLNPRWVWQAVALPTSLCLVLWPAGASGAECISLWVWGCVAMHPLLAWPGLACAWHCQLHLCLQRVGFAFVGFCFLFLFLFFNVKRFFTQVILMSKRKQTEANIRKYKP